jgi:ferredoxin-NADP reductase
MSMLTNTPMAFIRKQRLTGDVYAFHFKPARPLPHTAGQHGFLQVPGYWLPKPFSLASAPEDDEVVIATHVHANSPYKQALAALQPGAMVHVRGPVFSFVLRPADTDVVFLAQGIGITPYRSLLRHIAVAAPAVRAKLIHVDSGSHVFKDETMQLASAALYPDGKEAFAAAVRATVAAQPGARYYISGSVAFIAATTQQLRQQGIVARQIKRDWFLGYDHPKTLLRSARLLLFPKR